MPRPSPPKNDYTDPGPFRGWLSLPADADVLCREEPKLITRGEPESCKDFPSQKQGLCSVEQATYCVPELLSFCPLGESISSWLLSS